MIVLRAAFWTAVFHDVCRGSWADRGGVVSLTLLVGYSGGICCSKYCVCGGSRRCQFYFWCWLGLVGPLLVGVLRGFSLWTVGFSFLGVLVSVPYFPFWIGLFNLLVGAWGAVFFSGVPLGGCILCLGGFVGTPSGRSDSVARDLVLPLDGRTPLLGGLLGGVPSGWTLFLGEWFVLLDGQIPLLGALCSAQFGWRRLYVACDYGAVVGVLFY